MNIPFEMIIIAAIAVAILVAIIAVVLKKRNQEVDDDYQWSSEKRSVSNIHSSHITSKLGAIIFIFAFVAACAIHLLIWLSAGPSEDIVALCAKPSFFEGKIVLPFAFFESVLFAIIVTEIFEVFIAILTKQEIKKITKPGTLLGFIIFFLVGTAIFSYATFKYEVITEDGYESHSLLRSVRCYQWEDMASFTYDDDERFWNDIVARVEFEGTSKKFKLESRKFKILTEAACEKYNDDSEAMFDYIFLEKYAYINEHATEGN